MIEFADGRRIDRADTRGSNPFTARWGVVPTDPDERRKWIALHARIEGTRSRQRKISQVRRARLELAAKRHGPE